MVSYGIRTGKDLRNDALEKILPFLEDVFKKVNTTDGKYEAKFSMEDLGKKVKLLATIDPAIFSKFESFLDMTIRGQLHWDNLQVKVNLTLNKESKSVADCLGSSNKTKKQKNACILDLLRNGIKFKVILDKKPYQLEVAIEKDIAKVRATAEGFEMNIAFSNNHAIVKIIADDKQVELRIPPSAHPPTKHSPIGPPAYSPRQPAKRSSAGPPRPTLDEFYEMIFDTHSLNDNYLDRLIDLPFLKDGADWIENSLNIVEDLGDYLFLEMPDFFGSWFNSRVDSLPPVIKMMAIFDGKQVEYEMEELTSGRVCDHGIRNISNYKYLHIYRVIFEVCD